MSTVLCLRCCIVPMVLLQRPITMHDWGRRCNLCSERVVLVWKVPLTLKVADMLRCAGSGLVRNPSLWPSSRIVVRQVLTVGSHWSGPRTQQSNGKGSPCGSPPPLCLWMNWYIVSACCVLVVFIFLVSYTSRLLQNWSLFPFLELP